MKLSKIWGRGGERRREERRKRAAVCGRVYMEGQRHSLLASLGRKTGKCRLPSRGRKWHQYCFNPQTSAVVDVSVRTVYVSDGLKHMP